MIEFASIWGIVAICVIFGTVCGGVAGYLIGNSSCDRILDVVGWPFDRFMDLIDKI